MTDEIEGLIGLSMICCECLHRADPDREESLSDTKDYAEG